MNVEQHIRQNYELRPYPPLGRSGRFRPVWRIAPMEWIDAMCPPAQPEPRRILVAGCGTGNEAFALRKRFPKAEIVAVDFSARSLKLARQLQEKFRIGREIRFRRADLTARNFSRTVRGEFDFITCHGVLSYIPESGRALRNLARVLGPSGVLYLGVNGARHFSAEWRPLLEEFGFDLNAFEDSRRLRSLLQLWDSLAEHPAVLVAKLPAEYLAGDLFGAMIANYSLDHWVALAQRSGLHFCGSYGAHHALRPALNRELYDRFLPRSRAATHLIAERIAPSSFHALVFSAAPRPLVPWDNHSRLLRCRVRLTTLYRVAPWRGKKPRFGSCSLSLRSEATNRRADLSVPSWVVALLEAANHAGEAGAILGAAARRPAPRPLRQHLYLLQLLGVINLNPAG